MRGMATHSIPRTVLGVVLAILTAGACGGSNGLRGIECVDTPDDLCGRLAEHIVSTYPHREPAMSPIEKVTVSPLDCADMGADLATTCWSVVGTTRDGREISAPYYQREDGALVAPTGGFVPPP
jgi:hypothetical protein